MCPIRTDARVAPAVVDAGVHDLEHPLVGDVVLPRGVERLAVLLPNDA